MIEQRLAAKGKRLVYADLATRAQASLLAGRSVIADAVYAKPEERGAIEAVAAGRPRL